MGLWPLRMIGPMVPSAYRDQQIERETADRANIWKSTSNICLRWLDKRPQTTVIYASLGSIAELSAKQVEEIA